MPGKQYMKTNTTKKITFLILQYSALKNAVVAASLRLLHLLLDILGLK